MSSPTKPGLSVYEVADLLGIRYYKIIYAEKVGDLPPPRRINGRRVYSVEDVERIRRHFEERAARCMPRHSAH